MKRKKVHCPWCFEEMKLVSNESSIYARANQKPKMRYMCTACGAVGPGPCSSPDAAWRLTYKKENELE